MEYPITVVHHENYTRSTLLLLGTMNQCFHHDQLTTLPNVQSFLEVMLTIVVYCFKTSIHGIITIVYNLLKVIPCEHHQYFEPIYHQYSRMY